MCINVYLDKWPQNTNLFFDTFKFRQSFWTFQFLVFVWRALSTHTASLLSNHHRCLLNMYIKQEIRCFYGIESSDTGAQIFFSRSWFNFIDTRPLLCILFSTDLSIKLCKSHIFTHRRIDTHHAQHILHSRTHTDNRKYFKGNNSSNNFFFRLRCWNMWSVGNLRRGM